MRMWEKKAVRENACDAWREENQEGTQQKKNREAFGLQTRGRTRMNKDEIET